MTDAESTLLGVVLAGGRSRRFGSPKALATFRGEALWERAARVMSRLGLPVVVLANDADVREAIARGDAAASADGAAAADPDARGDLRPDPGPLGGIETGLAEAGDRGHSGIVVLACDLVLVEADMLAELTRVWPGRGATAFAAPGPWGIAPLCSIWGTDLLPRVSQALDEGRGSVGELLLAVPHVSADLTTASPGADPARIFRSTNRPGDLTELEAGIGSS